MSRWGAISALEALQAGVQDARTQREERLEAIHAQLRTAPLIREIPEGYVDLVNALELVDFQVSQDGGAWDAPYAARATISYRVKSYDLPVASTDHKLALRDPDGRRVLLIRGVEEARGVEVPDGGAPVWTVELRVAELAVANLMDADERERWGRHNALQDALYRRLGGGRGGEIGL